MELDRPAAVQEAAANTLAVIAAEKSSADLVRESRGILALIALLSSKIETVQLAAVKALTTLAAYGKLVL